MIGQHVYLYVKRNFVSVKLTVTVGVDRWKRQRLMDLVPNNAYMLTINELFVPNKAYMLTINGLHVPNNAYMLMINELFVPNKSYMLTFYGLYVSNNAYMLTINGLYVSNNAYQYFKDWSTFCTQQCIYVND